MNQPERHRILNWLIFILLSVIWGSSFILMKEGMKSLNAWQVASLRIFSAGLVLTPFMLAKFKSVSRKDIPLIFLSGLLGTFIPAYLFCLAETQLNSAIAGILNALTPLFTLIIGVAFFQATLGIRKWMGVLIGFSGLVFLVSSGQRLDFSNFQYSGLVILATLCYGINVNMVSKYLRHIPSLMLASLAFGMLIIPSGLVLLITGYGKIRGGGFVYSSLASAVLGILGTAVASILFYMLMKRAGALFASMVTYGIPFVALFWGFMAGEMIGAVQVLCLALILAGVYVANK